MRRLLGSLLHVSTCVAVARAFSANSDGSEKPSSSKTAIAAAFNLSQGTVLTNEQDTVSFITDSYLDRPRGEVLCLLSNTAPLFPWGLRFLFSSGVPTIPWPSWDPRQFSLTGPRQKELTI